MLFARVERDRAAMHVGAYGISMTTLEEVFMRIAHVGEAEVGQAFSIPRQPETWLLPSILRFRVCWSCSLIDAVWAQKKAIEEDHHHEGNGHVSRLWLPLLELTLLL